MMIRFDEIDPAVATAMCMPINEVLPADERKNRGALYIGSWIASVDQDLLDSHNIRQIISVIDSEMMMVPPSNGRRAHRIPIADSSRVNLKPYLDAACRCIAENLEKGNNVLVHCQQVRTFRVHHLHRY